MSGIAKAYCVYHRILKDPAAFGVKDELQHTGLEHRVCAGPHTKRLSGGVECAMLCTLFFKGGGLYSGLSSVGCATTAAITPGNASWSKPLTHIPVRHSKQVSPFAQT